MITVRDAGGNALAELRPGHPCRGTIGPLELIVGGPPLVAQVGDVRWSGTDEGSNGTMLLRDDERIARIFPVGDPAAAAVLDTHGVALARIAATAGSATVKNAAGAPVRALAANGDTIAIDSPVMSVQGTTDLVLAALLTAPELTPEVRILAACERVLVKGS